MNKISIPMDIYRSISELLATLVLVDRRSTWYEHYLRLYWKTLVLKKLRDNGIETF